MKKVVLGLAVFFLGAVLFLGVVFFFAAVVFFLGLVCADLVGVVCAAAGAT